MVVAAEVEPVYEGAGEYILPTKEVGQRKKSSELKQSYFTEDGGLCVTQCELSGSFVQPGLFHTCSVACSSTYNFMHSKSHQYLKSLLEEGCFTGHFKHLWNSMPIQYQDSVGLNQQSSLPDSFPHMFTFQPLLRPTRSQSPPHSLASIFNQVSEKPIHYPPKELSL